MAGLGTPCPQLPAPSKGSSAEPLLCPTFLPSAGKAQNTVPGKGSDGSHHEDSLLLAQESKPCPGLGLAGTGQDLEEQPGTGGWPQPRIPAPASSLDASEVPFPWAQRDAGH